MIKEIYWKKFWERFDDLEDLIAEEFQNEMVAKFGEGLYLLSDEERWNRQKRIIEKLVSEGIEE